MICQDRGHCCKVQNVICTYFHTSREGKGGKVIAGLKFLTASSTSSPWVEIRCIEHCYGVYTSYTSGQYHPVSSHAMESTNYSTSYLSYSDLQPTHRMDLSHPQSAVT